MLRVGITRQKLLGGLRSGASLRGRHRLRAHRIVRATLVVLALPFVLLAVGSAPASASGNTYYPSVNFAIYDLTTGGYAGGGGYLTVNYNDEVDFVACLDSGDGSQGNHSLGINDSNGWWGAGGV